MKRKWKNIKDHYRKELKKIPPTRSGDAANDFVSSWKHFRQMSFMRDQIQPSRSESNITTELTSDSDVNDDTQNSFRSVASPLSSIAVSSPAHSPALSSVASTSSRGKRKKSANELRSEFLKIEKQRLLLLQNKESTPSITQEAPKSDDYHYLMSLLPQLEQFKGIQKLRVRNKINSIIMAELQKENLPDPYMTQYGYHSAPQDNLNNY